MQLREKYELPQKVSGCIVWDQYSEGRRNQKIISHNNVVFTILQIHPYTLWIKAKLVYF